MPQLGKYQLIRKLAAGGMAEVFLAKAAGPMGFEKTLVLKRILPHLAGDPAFVKMFLSEAKLVAQLNHPNIVQIFDFGQAGGSYFLAMEYIDGPTLRGLIKRARLIDLSLPVALCARIVSLACEGLAFAHEFRDPATGEPLGIIHRDISPDNILLSSQGAVKVVDFGIAKVAGQSQHTQPGVVKGKISYMSPEQLRSRPLDRRADVYALGIVLYEMLTGRRPFDAASDVKLMQAIINGQRVPAVSLRPDLPASLQQILDRAVAKEREERYPDCRAFQEDLERFILSTGEHMGAYQIAQITMQLVGDEFRTSSSTSIPALKTPPSSPSAPERVTDEHTAPAMMAAGRTDPPNTTDPDFGPSEETSPGRVGLSSPTLTAVMGNTENSQPTTQALEPPEALNRRKLLIPAVLLGVALLGGGYVVARRPAAQDEPKPGAGAAPSPADAASRDAGPAPSARRLKGTMEFRIWPYAHVFLDGQDLGQTPLEPMDVTEGWHTVKAVNRELGKEVTRHIEVQPGKLTVIRINLSEE